MLVLSRRDGDWVEITCRATGATIRVRTCHFSGRIDLAFDDPADRFDIRRTERTTTVYRPLQRPPYEDPQATV